MSSSNQARMWVNRQSAARSKERKVRYTAGLDRKVRILRTESSSLDAELNLLQRNTNGLTAENSELELLLQTTEQLVELQDAMNEELKEEIQQLKVLTAQALSNQSSFDPNNQEMHTLLTAHHFQQLELDPQKQQHQFQQHQLHELRQPQEAALAQHAGDFEMRPSMPLSDPSSGESKDD